MPANTNLLDGLSKEDGATMSHMHAVNRLRLTLHPPANTDMSWSDILLVPLLIGTLNLLQLLLLFHIQLPF